MIWSILSVIAQVVVAWVAIDIVFVILWAYAHPDLSE